MKTFRLGGLDPAARYEVTDLDVGTAAIISGKHLMEKGLTVDIKNKPGAALIAYQRAKPGAAARTTIRSP